MRLNFRSSLLTVIFSTVILAQAPSAIQFFLPGNALPGREIRFTLTRDDGRVEILFTDTKGKFQLTGDLLREREYIITAETDGRTYGTTTTRFRVMRNINYVPIFLNPLKTVSPAPKEIVDVAALDAEVPAEARASYEMGMKAVADAQADQAIESLKRAIALYPKYQRALNDLGVTYLKLNRLDEAADSFTQAVKTSKNFFPARLNLAITRNRQGRFQEAAELLKPLQKDAPGLEGLRAQFADSLTGQGKLSEAVQILKEELSDPNSSKRSKAEAHFKLGVLFNRQEKFAEAVAELEQAVSADPNAANSRLQLGGALLQLKRLPEAERELLKAYELGGSAEGAAQLFLGQLYFMQQKYELAVRAFEQYLRDIPNAPNATQIKDAIEKIRPMVKKN